MSFLSPLWILLLPVGYLVILLHKRHPRRREEIVPSILLWQRVSRVLAEDAGWRRLAANLLLILQLLTLAALMLALMQPVFTSLGKALRHDIVILDTSLSMAAADVPGVPHRLAAVVQKLTTTLAGRRPHLVTVIEAGPLPEVLYNGPGDLSRLAGVLNGVEVKHGAPDWEGAALLAHSLATSQTTGLLLATDGSFPADELQPFAEMFPHLPLTPVVAAGEGENAAITAFSARQAGSSLSECDVFVRVVNHGKSPAEIPLVVAGKNGVIERLHLKLEPGEVAQHVFPYEFATEEVLEARLEWSDALPHDNVAYLTAYPPEPTRVLLIGAGNYYLEQGLRIFPQVRLERRLLYPEGTSYPLVIFDRLPVPENFTGTALQIVAGSGLETVSRPQVVRYDRVHPVTRFIDWSEIAIARAFRLPPYPGAKVLVESEAGPLMQLIENEQATILQLAFRLEDSDWPLKVAFPIFLSHLLQWVHPPGWAYVREAVAAGEAVALPGALKNEKGQWTVETPQGQKVGIPAAAASFRAAYSGLYYILSGAGRWPFAVNAGSDREADLHSRLVLPTSQTGEAVQGAAPPRRPLWPWLVAAAFILLLAEGWLYINKGRRPNLRPTLIRLGR
ncbi:MAG TPA: VWA domain-containing protein [Firmicutes bacterium]|nr:VWA domain-containing protein [Bacillota bacterium]